MYSRSLGFACAIAMAPIAAHAQLHSGDIILASGGSPARVQTGGSNGITFTSARVFTARFGDTGFSNRTTNPGFNAIPNQYFTGAVTGLTMTRALRKWDGQDLCAIPAETITFTKLGITATSPAVDPTNGAGPSVSVGISDPFDGLLHEHGAFALTSPSSAGVYALELSVWVGTPSNTNPAPSQPFWIVFNQNGSTQDVDACVAFLLANGASQSDTIISPCPCTADFNRSGTIDVQDIFDYLNAWFSGSTSSDIDGASGVTVQDIFAFLNAWFAGCP